MKVALVQAPYWTRETPPMALALLAAVLRREGHKVYNFDFNNSWYGLFRRAEEESGEAVSDQHFWRSEKKVSDFASSHEKAVNDAVESMLDSGAEVVGFSLFSSSALMSLELAGRIKRKDPKRIIIFGGVHCLPVMSGDSFINQPQVDAVAIGEGEETFREFVDNIAKSGKMTDCPGVVYKSAGKIIDSGPRKPIEDIDSLPYPDFSGFDIRSYGIPDKMPVLFSRGCVNRCVFCDTNAMWPKFRYMSGERMYREIEHGLGKAYKHAESITFLDCLINGNVKELGILCDLIVKNTASGAIQPLYFEGNAILSKKMTPEILAKLKAAGCEYLTYGLESGSDKVLAKMGKNITSLEAERVIRDTFNAGIRPTLNFMFGFPGEDREDFRQTLNFLKRNYRYIDEVKPSETLCYLSNYMFNHLEEFGISEPLHPEYWKVSDGSNDYPERVRRYEEFCALIKLLGIRPPELIGFTRENLNIPVFRKLMADKNSFVAQSLAQFPEKAKILKKADDDELLHVLNFLLSLLKLKVDETKLGQKYRDYLHEEKVPFDLKDTAERTRKKIVLNRRILELTCPEIAPPNPVLDRMILNKERFLKDYYEYERAYMDKNKKRPAGAEAGGGGTCA